MILTHAHKSLIRSPVKAVNLAFCWKISLFV